MITRALRQWWTRTNDQLLLDAQEKLLTRFVRSPLQSVEKRHGLNVVEFARSDRTGLLPTVVLLHGYGSGLGFFFQNIDPLLYSGKVGRVLLVDWLGTIYFCEVFVLLSISVSGNGFRLGIKHINKCICSLYAFLSVSAV